MHPHVACAVRGAGFSPHQRAKSWSIGIAEPIPAFSSSSGVNAATLHTNPRRLFSPNGAVTQSPGLVRPRTYPGCASVTLFNPKGVAAQMTHTRPRYGEAATPSGLIDYWNRLPRVARASQPWASGRSPFGAGFKDDSETI